MADAPLKVLIVDDEAPARRRLRELLDDCTSALPLVVVGEAASGREALTLLGTWRAHDTPSRPVVGLVVPFPPAPGLSPSRSVDS